MWKPVMMEQMMCLLLTESPQKSLLQVTLLTSISQYSLCPFCLFCSKSPRRSSEPYWDDTDRIPFFLSYGLKQCFVLCSAELCFKCLLAVGLMLWVTRVIVLFCFFHKTVHHNRGSWLIRLVGAGARSSRSNRGRIEHWGSLAFPNCPSAVFYVKLKPDFS